MEDHLTCTCIAEIAAIASVLVAVPHLEPGCLRVKGRQMHGITMTEARIVESASVIVNSHGAIGNLVASVTIHIGHAQVMVTLSGITGPLRVFGIEGPAVPQLLAIPVPGSNDATGIITAAEDTAGMYPVQIAYGSQITLRSVGVVVTPVFHPAPFGNIVGRSHGRSCQSVKHGDIFRPIHDAPRLVVGIHVEETPSPVVDFRLGHRRWQPLLYLQPLLPPACSLLAFLFYFLQVSLRVSLDGSDAIAPVGLRVADYESLSVGSPVGRLHHQLGSSVTVEVEHHELHVMRPAADVPPQVDAPEASAVKPVAVDKRGAGESRKHIILGVRRVPFQEYLILSVAVHVADACVAGHVSVTVTVRRSAALRFLQGYGQIAVGRIAPKPVGAAPLPGAHLIEAPLRVRLLVNEERSPPPQWAAVKLHPVAIHIERFPRSIAAEHAPADDHPSAVAHGHHSTIQPFTLQRCPVVAGLRFHRRSHHQGHGSHQKHSFSHSLQL